MDKKHKDNCSSNIYDFLIALSNLWTQILPVFDCNAVTSSLKMSVNISL